MPQECCSNSPKYIKFALGENVNNPTGEPLIPFVFLKQEWELEQVFIDYFPRAKEYDALKKSGNPYRKTWNWKPWPKSLIKNVYFMSLLCTVRN